MEGHSAQSEEDKDPIGAAADTATEEIAAIGPSNDWQGSLNTAISLVENIPPKAIIGDTISIIGKLNELSRAVSKILKMAEV
jgi:hypothetical protein